MTVLWWVLLGACVEPDPVEDDPTDTVDTAAEDTRPADDTAPPVETADSGPVPATEVVVSAGEPVVCADPAGSGPPVFSAVDPGGAWASQTYDPDAETLFAGGGVTVTDLDGDGVVDVLRTSHVGGSAWLALAPGGAVDRTDELPELPAQTGSMIPVDVDADGDLDLHVPVWGGPDMLLRRDADGWVDVAGALGLAGADDGLSVGASWGDADGDGDLDAFVGVHGLILEEALPLGQPSHLFLQQDDGTFVDAVAALPSTDPLHRAHTFQALWMQLDEDVALEPYVVNDFGWRYPNAAYDLLPEGLVRLIGRGFESDGTNMGVAAGDLNGDGVEDLVVTDIRRVVLYLTGRVGWADASVVKGLVPDFDGGQEVAWGVSMSDLDHDADLDVLVAFGQLDEAARIPENTRNQPDELWVNRGDGGFDAAGAAWGLDLGGVARGMVVADVTGDGWLDVVRQDLVGPTTIHAAPCGASHWIEVVPRWPGSANPFAVGTRVVGTTTMHTVSDVVRAGGISYASAGPLLAHLGLADATTVDLEITWPDGRVDTLEDVEVDRRVTVTRTDP